MLKVRDLRAGYGKSEVLRGISFDVHQGEVVTIVGVNGAGKSTTLRTLCGAVPALAGTISFDGTDITNRSSSEIVERGLTMIPEGRQLFPFLTVKDNLLMGAYKQSARAGVNRRLEQVLEMFPRVEERLSQFAGSLSGGEQQMVAIARGMMADPKLLIFDEPSLGLSPLLVEMMFEIIQKITASGITVLIVEQNVFHTLQLADRGYVLENGEISLTGTGRELLKSDHVRKAYLGM